MAGHSEILFSLPHCLFSNVFGAVVEEAGKMP
jgi:hypothetical protein